MRDGNDIEKESKPIITTTLFPQYDFANIIVGDKFDVILLLPPGVEAHSFELTPKDMSTIMNSDLFIYTGNIMEPWVNNILDTLVEENVNVLDLSEGIKLKILNLRLMKNMKGMKNHNMTHITGQIP
jgi:ABC-type metal ion transport system, periplasmic component/surface adhesin